MRLSFLCAFLGFLASCGSVNDPAPPDTSAGTAPRVVSTTPSTGGTGVASDAIITVEFSKPMAAASVVAAYSSNDLPAATVTLAWDSAGKVLTITPMAPLEYAAGTDPAAVVARTYAFAIGMAATDVEGNALAEPLALSFTTLRRITHGFAYDSLLTGHVPAGGGTAIPCGGSAASLPFCAGDTFQTNFQIKGFATFQISPLPTGITRFVSATFTIVQIIPTGAPYPSLGTLVLENVTFSTLNLVAFNAAPLRSLGALSSDSTQETKTVDVRAALEDDYANRATRNNRSQMRAAFTNGSNNNGAADWTNWGTPQLSAVYLVP